MRKVYFHCSNAEEVLVDRRGAMVSDLAEACGLAAGVAQSVVRARSLEDLHDWMLRVSNDLGDELFVVPFAFVVRKRH